MMDFDAWRMNKLAGTLNEATWDTPRRGDWIAIVSGPSGSMAFEPVAKGTRKADYLRANPEVHFIAIVEVKDA